MLKGGRIMYYTLSIQPELEATLEGAISAFRREYDPTVGFTRPHITVLFPVPGRVGEVALIAHIEQALSGWSTFEIELGGFHKSRDFWLFLTPTEGREQLRGMYRALYSGILAEFRREDIDYVPHVSLGHFLKPGASYDWNNPQASDFDGFRYEEALQRAQRLPLPARVLADRLHMSAIPDAIIEWATGKRARLPEDPEIDEVRTFDLG